MNTLAERLKFAREQVGISQKELASRVGVSQQAIGLLEKGSSKKSAHIHRLAKELKVNADWLETGAGAPYASKENKTNVEIGPGITGQVPLISWVQAGAWCGVHDPYPVGTGERMIYTTAHVSPNSYALRIEGDSMVNPHGAPSFPPGAILIVDPQRQFENRNFVIAKLNEQEEATFKQLVIDAGEMYLKPLNPNYKTINITGQNVSICGVVRQMVMDLE